MMTPYPRNRQARVSKKMEPTQIIVYLLKILFTVTSLSHAMRPGLQIRHFWVAKSLFLTITFNEKKQDKTFLLLNNC